jgi:hypothetical protein
MAGPSQQGEEAQPHSGQQPLRGASDNEVQYEQPLDSPRPAARAKAAMRERNMEASFFAKCLMK